MNQSLQMAKLFLLGSETKGIVGIFMDRLLTYTCGRRIDTYRGEDRG